MDRRAVVTGIGVISPAGSTKDLFWKNITQGKSGISEIKLFDTSKYNRHFGGEVKDFKAQDYISAQAVQYLGRASCFAIAATKMALKDSGLDAREIKGKDAAVIMGVTIPEGNSLDLSTEQMLNDELDSITKRAILNIFSPSVARNIGHFFNLKGINLMIPNACSAGNYCIGYGYDLIKNGATDLVIAGGSEALSRIAFQGFQRLYAMAQEVCSPFDKNRKGMLLGEGAGVLILEPLEKAEARNAPILAEVLGYGLSCDAHHMTQPKRGGIKKAMQKAIENSGLKPQNIDYISAHGTGTLQNDKEEAGAIKELFGEKRLPVSSIKSMLGHCMGAASAIESAACCLALRDGIIPPTINFKEADPLCDIDCVPNAARKTDLKYTLNNAFAFGGNNCCVIFARESKK